MQPQQIKGIMSLFPCFSDVPAEDWQSASLVVAHASSQHPVREGHLLQHAAFVVNGSIRVYKVSETGREVTLYRVQSGESCVLMLASILAETAYVASVSVETATEVLLLPVDTFSRWMDRYQPLRRYVYSLFVQRLVSVTNLLDNIAFKPINYRIAEFLFQHTANDSRTLSITHDHLAIELGTAREVVSRVLKDFEKQGYLRLGRGKIEHIQRAALEHSMRQLM